MKYYLILSIFCLVGANSLLMNQETGLELDVDEKKAMEQCALELNVDANKYTHTIDIAEYIENPDDETTCMMACGFRYLISEKISQSLTGSNNRETLYNGFMKIIDEAYKKPFDEVPVKYNREDIVNKVEQCYANETTECGFFKCVELYEPPYVFAFLQYIVHGFLNGATEFETGSGINDVVSE